MCNLKKYLLQIPDIRREAELFFFQNFNHFPIIDSVLTTQRIQNMLDAGGPVMTSYGSWSMCSQAHAQCCAMSLRFDINNKKLVEAVLGYTIRK